jgi:hypothetical protein
MVAVQAAREAIEKRDQLSILFDATTGHGHSVGAARAGKSPAVDTALTAKPCAGFLLPAHRRPRPFQWTAAACSQPEQIA